MSHPSSRVDDLNKGTNDGCRLVGTYECSCRRRGSTSGERRAARIRPGAAGTWGVCIGAYRKCSSSTRSDESPPWPSQDRTGRPRERILLRTPRLTLMTLLFFWGIHFLRYLLYYSNFYLLPTPRIMSSASEDVRERFYARISMGRDWDINSGPWTCWLVFSRSSWARKFTFVRSGTDRLGVLKRIFTFVCKRNSTII